MKIYFCGSIRGGRDLAATYFKMITILQSYGKVLTEHLGSDEEIESKDRILSDKTIHDRDMQWIVRGRGSGPAGGRGYSSQPGCWI